MFSMWPPVSLEGTVWTWLNRWTMERIVPSSCIRFCPVKCISVNLAMNSAITAVMVCLTSKQQGCSPREAYNHRHLSDLKRSITFAHISKSTSFASRSRVLWTRPCSAHLRWRTKQQRAPLPWSSRSSLPFDDAIYSQPLKKQLYMFDCWSRHADRWHWPDYYAVWRKLRVISPLSSYESNIWPRS